MAPGLNGETETIQPAFVYPRTLTPSRFSFFWQVSGILIPLFIIIAAAIFFSQKILTIDSGEQRADALVVLGGGFDERAARAAELFKKGAAPEILVSGFGDTQLTVSMLKKYGVPASVIAQEGKSRSTLENAKFSIPLLRQWNAHQVIIVTSWFHSRRALACFKHFAPDIQFYSCPSYLSYERPVSGRYGIIDDVFLEYVKMLAYWIYHGVRPF